MLEEKAKELYEQNAEGLQLNFTYYYQYMFSFNAENDNLSLDAVFGGEADSVMRYEVTNEPFPAPKTFEELLSQYSSVT
ncbi:hypothetical protein HZA97_04190 [Candidatus Woesearchaeota archaeon]|nr:hypothetical protein [Candidatus Woesearchaeota archaeon]